MADRKFRDPLEIVAEMRAVVVEHPFLALGMLAGLREAILQERMQKAQKCWSCTRALAGHSVYVIMVGDEVPETKDNEIPF